VVPLAGNELVEIEVRRSVICALVSFIMLELDWVVIWLVMIDVLVVWFGVDAEDICARVDADSSLLLGDPVLLRSVTLAEVFFISNFRPVCLLTMWFFFLTMLYY